MPVRRRIAVAVAILAVLLAHGPAALHAQDTAGWPPEVLDVEFRGNTVFSGDQLASAIATRSTSCKLPFPLSVVCVFGAARERFYLNDVQLALDSLRISSLYAVHGYREAEVRKDTISGKDGGVHVVFYVREGRPVRVRTLEVVGGEGILPDGIEARLPLKIGDPFDMNRMEASRDTPWARCTTSDTHAPRSSETPSPPGGPTRPRSASRSSPARRRVSARSPSRGRATSTPTSCAGSSRSRPATSIGRTR